MTQHKKLHRHLVLCFAGSFTTVKSMENQLCSFILQLVIAVIYENQNIAKHNAWIFSMWT